MKIIEIMNLMKNIINYTFIQIIKGVIKNFIINENKRIAQL